MSFKDPLFFILLPVFALLVFARLRRRQGALRYSSAKLAGEPSASWRTRLLAAPLALRCAAAALFIFALARPQKGIEESKIETAGIGIALGVDISGSMLAEDYEIEGKYANRLDVVKEVVREFVAGRPGDRIGLVVFAGRPYTQCPITLDTRVLLELLDGVKVGMIEDGTAIGSALATCVARLKNAPDKSKVAVLLTDGVNNAGNVDPLTAAELAKSLGVRVHAIGVGSEGMSRYPTRDFFGNTVYRQVHIPVDDALLRQVAESTGGRYFRANDTESLQAIFKEIDRMEKTTAEVSLYVDYRELFHWFLIPALCCFLAELGLSRTVLRKLP